MYVVDELVHSLIMSIPSYKKKLLNWSAVALVAASVFFILGAVASALPGANESVLCLVVAGVCFVAGLVGLLSYRLVTAHERN